MAKNLQNLKPFQTVEEARAHGVKGGKKSGETRRRQATFKTIVSQLLKSTIKKELLDAEVQKLISTKVLTSEEGVALAQISKALKGDTAAAVFLRDSSGNKPKNEIDIEGDLKIKKFEDY